MAAVIERETVEHVARLARLRLDSDDIERMRRELSGILEHIELIQSLDLEDVPPTTHVVALQNVLRDDTPLPSLPRELALREAPAVLGDGFEVRGWIESHA